jgi:hypothetical protein
LWKDANHATSSGMEESRQAHHKNDGILKRATSFASGAFTGATDALRSTFSPAKPRKKYPSPWDLPVVSDEEIRRKPSSTLKRQFPSKQVSRIQNQDSEDEDESSDDQTSGLH